MQAILICAIGVISLVSAGSSVGPRQCAIKVLPTLFWSYDHMPNAYGKGVIQYTAQHMLQKRSVEDQMALMRAVYHHVQTKFAGKPVLGHMLALMRPVYQAASTKCQSRKGPSRGQHCMAGIQSDLQQIYDGVKSEAIRKYIHDVPEKLSKMHRVGQQVRYLRRFRRTFMAKFRGNAEAEKTEKAMRGLMGIIKAKCGGRKHSRKVLEEAEEPQAEEPEAEEEEEPKEYDNDGDETLARDLYKQTVV